MNYCSNCQDTGKYRRVIKPDIFSRNPPQLQGPQFVELYCECQRGRERKSLDEMAEHPKFKELVAKVNENCSVKQILERFEKEYENLDS